MADAGQPTPAAPSVWFSTRRCVVCSPPLATDTVSRVVHYDDPAQPRRSGHRGVEDGEVGDMSDPYVHGCVPLPLPRVTLVADREGADIPRETLTDYWWRAASEEITEEEAGCLLAPDVPEVTLSLAMNGAAPPAVLAAIFEKGGPPAAAVPRESEQPA